MILQVGAPAAGGACVAHAPDGRVVFVRHALPGETVRVEVTSEGSRFLRADAVEVLQASPDRVEPTCPWARPDACGGCDLQHASRPAQLVWKAALVAEQLRRLAGVELAVDVEPVGDDVTGWRSRVSYAVGPDGRAGLRRHRSHDVVPVGYCELATPAARAVPVLEQRWPAGATVAVAADGRQRVVSLQRSAPGRDALPTLPPDVGLLEQGRAVRTPHGLAHRVLGRRFEVAADGFWQVHPQAPEVLVGAVRQALRPRSGERVADLYAGVGLFAAFLADEVGPEGSVVAVESDRRACADAARNLADLPQARVRTAPVTAALVSALDVDLVVLDPPRAGAGLEVAEALASLPAPRTPRAVCYVACDPASFARDLAVFVRRGWSLAHLRALDLFPQTEHVETVALLTPPGAAAAGAHPA